MLIVRVCDFRTKVELADGRLEDGVNCLELNQLLVWLHQRLQLVCVLLDLVLHLLGVCFLFGYGLRLCFHQLDLL